MVFIRKQDNNLVLPQNVWSICSVNLIMPFPDQTKKELDHIFFNLFELCPWDEECWNEDHFIFISFLSDVAWKYGTCAIALLSYEKLRKVIAKPKNQDTNLPCYLYGYMMSLQFCLKNLQEKLLFSFDSSFYYSSIDESDFRRFWKYLDCMI